MREHEILLDDGEFIIEERGAERAGAARGYLSRRGPEGAAGATGSGCIGGFERTEVGAWRASITVPYDEQSDSDTLSLGEFQDKLDATTALWKARHRAWLSPCPHVDAFGADLRVVLSKGVANLRKNAFQFGLDLN